MSSSPISNSVTPLPPQRAERTAPARAPEHRPPTRRADALDEIDAVQALVDFGEELTASPAQGLADQLLEFLAPRPRNPQTLTQSRIVPLLGLAADLLGRVADTRNDVVMLGATALEQELRMQRALAERRATLMTIA